MEDENIAGSIKCPHCGAANSAESEYCTFCYKKLGSEAEKSKKKKTLPEKPIKSKEDGKEAKNFWIRIIIIAALFIFYTQWLKHDKYFSFLDYVNLAFHEPGHLVFAPFGHFLMMAGGTISQLLMPLICLIYFLKRNSELGWQLCLFWIGENLLNISIYAGDAIRQELPLVAGGVHDWTYLLTATGLIAHTPQVEKFIFLLGSATIFLSFYFIGRDALNFKPLKL